MKQKAKEKKAQAHKEEEERKQKEKEAKEKDKKGWFRSRKGTHKNPDGSPGGPMDGPRIFKCSLEEIMGQQADKPDLKIPVVLQLLTDAVMRLGGSFLFSNFSFRHALIYLYVFM